MEKAAAAVGCKVPKDASALGFKGLGFRFRG